MAGLGASVPDIYVAGWSRGPTIVGIVLIGAVPTALALNELVSGQFIGGFCALAVVTFLSALALVSVHSKYVAVSPTNLEIGKGIWTRKVVSIPLERIDKITINSGYVRVSAGTLFNRVDLVVKDPQKLAEKLESARSEIGARRPNRVAGRQVYSEPLRAVSTHATAPPVRHQAVGGWLVTGVLVALVVGFSRCSKEPQVTTCPNYTAGTRLTCERLASECLRGNNMTDEPGCRAVFPNGY
jgi:hypothetical protein